MKAVIQVPISIVLYLKSCLYLFSILFDVADFNPSNKILWKTLSIYFFDGWRLKSIDSKSRNFPAIQNRIF